MNESYFLLTKIAPEYAPAIKDALPWPGLKLDEMPDENGYVSLMDADHMGKRDLSCFWKRYNAAKKELNAQGIYNEVDRFLRSL